MTTLARGLLLAILTLTVVATAEAQARKRDKNVADKKSATTKNFPQDPLSVALQATTKAAVRKKTPRVLVVVRDNARNETEIDRTELLDGIRRRIVEQLSSLKLETKESAEVEKLANLTRPLAAVRSTDLRVFQNFAKFDAILDVVVTQRGAKNSLGMTLVTDKAKLWSSIVAAPTIQQEPSVAKAEGNGGKANAKPQATFPPLNRRVLQFALSQLGQKVGNGECWTLAAQALIQAGARPANLFNFGQQIPLAQIVPGDILQFKSVRFDIGKSYYLFGAPDHTAIVLGVEGSKVSILHQNFGKKIVSTMTIDFKHMTKGKVWAWRPIGR